MMYNDKSKHKNTSHGYAQSYALDEQQISRATWGELGPRFYIKSLIVGVLFVYLFYNEIQGIVSRWVNDPSWSHGFLIPFFSLYFINQHKKDILNLQTKPSYLGLPLLIFAIIFYYFNLVSSAGFGYFKPLSMIASLAAVVLLLGGWRLIRHTWLPIVFLVFAVPLPQRIYFSLTRPMRELATIVAAALLNLVKDLEATSSGMIIDVIYKGQRMEPSLNVAEACSGMRLLMAFLALGVAMAYLHYRPIWQRIVLLATTIPIAIFCNMIRVTVTGCIYVLGNPKYAQGLYHDFLGLVMLPLAFALYGLIAWFMESLFVDETEANTEDVIIRRKD